MLQNMKIGIIIRYDHWAESANQGCRLRTHPWRVQDPEVLVSATVASLACAIDPYSAGIQHHN